MNPTTPSEEKPYHIVVGFDFSDLADRALDEAIRIATLRRPSELHVVTVAQSAGSDQVLLPGDTEPVREGVAHEIARERVAAIVKEHQTRSGPIGLEKVGVYVLSGTPAEEPARAIADLARAVDAELIVVGTHGRTGVSRFVLGSVAERVVREAPCSVQVVRPLDFVGGQKVPEIEPPLAPGQPHLKQFEHRRTYHYVDKIAPWPSRTMPVS